MAPDVIRQFGMFVTESAGSTTSVISAYRRWPSHLARTFAAERCAISSSYHADRQIRFALILLRNQHATSRRKAIITQHSTIGDKYGRKDLRKRRQVPVPGRPFVKDFVAAWNKVMNADRFDVA